MTSIKPITPLDENEHLRYIIRILQRESLQKLFLFLDNHFKKSRSITSKDIKINSIYIHFSFNDYSRCFHALESFVAMKLLMKEKARGKNSVVFIQDNDKIWNDVNDSLAFNKKKEEKGD